MISVNDEIVYAQWDRVRGRLRDEFGEAAFKSWLNPLSLAEIKNGQVRMGVPTRFLRDWVATHYADRIRSLWAKENASINTVDIVVLPGRADCIRQFAAWTVRDDRYGGGQRGAVGRSDSAATGSGG